MVLSAHELSKQVELGNALDPGGITIVPWPDLEKIKNDGEASVNLRLGRWFLALKQFGLPNLSIRPGFDDPEGKCAETCFVPFGTEYILHPNRFVLGSTLEWVRVPTSLAAFVVGKSTLGRRGVIIETAAGVHPGFSGCITLEIANVGEVPVKLIAGMSICQLFFHKIRGRLSARRTALAGQRKPRLGSLSEDIVLKNLIDSI